jgi:hypothetical protein
MLFFPAAKSYSIVNSMNSAKDDVEFLIRGSPFNLHLIAPFALFQPFSPSILDVCEVLHWLLSRLL